MSMRRMWCCSPLADAVANRTAELLGGARQGTVAVI